MILLIDNYDSFVYNLLHYFGELGAEVEVVRNDATTPEEILKRVQNGEINGIVISPGPETPDKAGICLDLVAKLAGHVPIFGVCLGHQTIAQNFGGKVIRASKPMHGKVSVINHDNQGVFKDIPEHFNATRYHSLIVEKDSLPDCFDVTARVKVDGEDDVIMGIAHKEYDIYGVQFHPESIASEQGHKILQNFLDIVNG